MSQAQVYEAAGFGQPVPRGTRPAIVVVDFSVNGGAKTSHGAAQKQATFMRALEPAGRA